MMSYTLSIRHLVTLGTFMFAQLKLIYERHIEYSHRTYKPLQNDSFVGPSEFGRGIYVRVAATVWQHTNLGFSRNYKYAIFC